MVESAEGVVLPDGKHVTIQAPAEMRPGERVTIQAGATEEQRREAAGEIRMQIVAALGMLREQAGLPYKSQEDASAIHEAFSRLLWLLGLSDAERAFVDACASATREGKPAAAYVELSVFADWLKDRFRDGDAATIEKISPQDGDVIIVATNDSALLSVSAAYANVGKPIKDFCESTGRRVYVQAVRAGLGVSRPDAGALQELGWVRYDSLARSRLIDALVGEPERENPNGELHAARDLIDRLKRENAEVRRAVASERERCAILAEGTCVLGMDGFCDGHALAAAIRSRPPV